jgi:hypothetical protein
VYSVPKLIEPNWLDCVLPDNGELGALYIGNLDAALSADTLKKHRIRAVLTTSVETGFRYAEESIHFHECNQSIITPSNTQVYHTLFQSI